MGVTTGDNGYDDEPTSREVAGWWLVIAVVIGVAFVVAC